VTRARSLSHDAYGLDVAANPKVLIGCLKCEGAQGMSEGRKSWAEINPELVAEAKRLRRRSPKGHQRLLRDVAAELAKLGFVNERGAEFTPLSIKSMLAA
jgi:hypothetical protein